ncbi:MAG: hypothetical protein AB1486_29050 [Planctomycetota bacterium]
MSPSRRLSLAALALLGIGAFAPCLAAGDTTTLVISTAPRPPCIEGLQYDPEFFDFRYAPHRWQAAICLPDDPHKSIVGSDGALYYDYGEGRFHAFKCRVKALLEGTEEPILVSQRLPGARVPVVITEQRAGPIVLQSRAWAAAPDAHQEDVAAWCDERHDYMALALTNDGQVAARGQLIVRIDPPAPLMADATGDRLVEMEQPGRTFATFWPKPERFVRHEGGALRPVGAVATLRQWAEPAVASAQRFRDILVGWGEPLLFRFEAQKRQGYSAVFGLIEGYHNRAGVRPLEIRGEGSTPVSVDPIATAGRNHPLLVPVNVADENGDGVVELGVHAVEGAEDSNTILAALWVFAAGSAPDEQEILSGAADGKALALLDAEMIESRNRVDVVFPAPDLQRGEKSIALIAIHRGPTAKPRATSAADAEAEIARAVQYWGSLALPYDRIELPDARLQELLDSCIRNIYQARELRGGRPAFQVGPTCYRGLWAADGPFILEAISYLGRAAEVRPGLELLTEGDEGPQGIEFSKQAGLRLWLISRHAELTGDMAWLQRMTPKVVAEVDRIREYRRMTRDDAAAANWGLMPIGFGDGGLGGQHREYTNVYWNLSGLRAALAMAPSLAAVPLAEWQAEYRDFWEVFERARTRDQLQDEFGNTYVPVTMKGEEPQLPQRGAWAFLHSVFPGRVYASDDPLMLGTMAMLSAVEKEGLIFGTGWLEDGIWNYAASFYAHAHLWLGHGRKAASILYAFANHACPLLCWREEQGLVDGPEDYVGDMPHNWASAEFIRLVRHLMILERGDELHLLEGLPQAWTRAGAVTRLIAVPTSFGDSSLSLAVSPDGTSAKLALDPPRRRPPARLAVHLEGFGRPILRVSVGKRALATEETLRIGLAQPLELTVELGK